MKVLEWKFSWTTFLDEIFGSGGENTVPWKQNYKNGVLIWKSVREFELRMKEERERVCEKGRERSWESKELYASKKMDAFGARRSSISRETGIDLCRKISDRNKNREEKNGTPENLIRTIQTNNGKKK